MRWVVTILENFIIASILTHPQPRWVPQYVKPVLLYYGAP